jgi:small-conductance mechanosensitive channel
MFANAHHFGESSLDRAGIEIPFPQRVVHLPPPAPRLDGGP